MSLAVIGVDGPTSSTDGQAAVFDGTTGKKIKSAGYTPREVLTADRTYYVRTDGSDSNTGLVNSSGGAFLTIQKAIDAAVSCDLSIYAITIQAGAGTFTGANVLKGYVGVGPITIVGDESTPSNVAISVTSNSCFTASSVSGTWRIRGVTISTTSAGHGINASGTPTYIEVQNCAFGTCATGYAHVTSFSGSSVRFTGSYSITGGITSGRHLYAEATGSISYSGTITVTLTGTPAFGIFALCDRAGLIITNSIPTFSGSATGQRYSVSLNSIIYTGGSGANFFPGNSAGATATGGQYA
ncbi:protein of unknown function [Hyphomicrobium sp. 1Nfss2.1]|uniref:hypothetical protein n=1 Tax=Hyphomicrobium sp. 1Nfss2.1 TaxID=3413936 RepID=UPI003C7A5EAD